MFMLSFRCIYSVEQQVPTACLFRVPLNSESFCEAFDSELRKMLRCCLPYCLETAWFCYRTI